MFPSGTSAFYAFMRERENVRLRKGAGDFFPWTEDEILRSYKFTNVYRHFDKTSQKLKELFYQDHFDDDPKSILMNAALFRYFGTWEFAEVIGWQEYDDFDFEGIKETARTRLANRERVFTGAYVITNQGISAPKQEVVVDYFLTALHAATPVIVDLVKTTNSWQKAADKMRTIGGFGGSGFMTKETLLDTTYCNFWGEVRVIHDMNFTTPADWETWTPIGPGARRGAARACGDEYCDKPLTEISAMNCIMELHEVQGEEWPREWERLSPHDVQFQLCEFDKYERVRLGQGRPRSRYRAP